MKHCFLFPGQGAQYPGMGKDLFDSSPAVRELFGRASTASDLNLERLLFSGSEDQLKQTDVTQVGVTLVNLSASVVLQERGIEPAGCAGFSLGEYAALTTAGIISIDDVFPLVKIRGKLSARAATELTDEGDAPAMSAVIGLSPDVVEATLASSGVSSVFPANLNSTKQTVIAGRTSGLDAVEGILKEAGARRIIRLKVTGAFHTPLMERIVNEFGAALAEVAFSDPEIPFYSNVTGAQVRTGAEAKELCLKQLTHPVRWVAEENNLVAEGYDDVLEVGPGSVLAGLWKSVPDAPPCYAAGTVAAIEELPAG